MSHDVSEIGLRARRRIALRLLPFLFILYLISYIDRTNVSLANLRMSADLRFSDEVYGLGVGLFFLGYVLFEVPGALIVERWSARKWLARIMITWGLATIFDGLVQTAHQFYAARFLVGVAEASFFPGVIIYLTHWFRLHDRGKAIASFYAAVPAASVAGSLLAGWLLEKHWLALAGWRWIFFVEGIAPIILGLITIFYLPDRPHQARWLPPDERDWITAELQAETLAKKKIRDYTIWEAFRERRVILLILAYFCAHVGAQASIYWIPTFIKRLSNLPNSKVVMLVALPGLVGIAGMLLNGWHSDKTQERRWHTVVPLICAGVAYVALSLIAHHFSIAMALLIFGGGLMFSYYPIFWSMPTMVLSESAAAASFGLINSIGHTGGFVGPYLVGYLNRITGASAAAFVFIGVSYLLAGSIISVIKIRNPLAANPPPS
jgi:MFS transporter, ACS family, tartrate transporter